MAAAKNTPAKSGKETPPANAAAAEVPVPAGPSTEERIAAWIHANIKAIGIAAGVIALVVAGTWFMSVAAKRKENFARTQLEQAWLAAEAGNVPQASSDFQKVVDNYGGTTAALEARLSLNQARLENGQNQLAADDLTGFLASNPPARFGSRAQLLRGAALENLGKPAEAGAAYEAAAGLAELDFEKAEAMLSAARSYRTAGQTDKAVTLLKTILEKYSQTAAYPVAEIRLGEIQKGS